MALIGVHNQILDRKTMSDGARYQMIDNLGQSHQLVVHKRTIEQPIHITVGAHPTDGSKKQTNLCTYSNY